MNSLTSLKSDLGKRIVTQNELIGKIQNKLDNFKFRSNELSSGWHKIYGFENKKIVSLNNRITLTENGKSVKTNSLPSNDSFDSSQAQKMLSEANRIAQNRIPQYNEEKKLREKIGTLLEESIRKIEVIHSENANDLAPDKLKETINKISSTIFRLDQYKEIYDQPNSSFRGYDDINKELSSIENELQEINSITLKSSSKQTPPNRKQKPQTPSLLKKVWNFVSSFITSVFSFFFYLVTLPLSLFRKGQEK